MQTLRYRPMVPAIQFLRQPISRECSSARQEIPLLHYLFPAASAATQLLLSIKPTVVTSSLLPAQALPNLPLPITAVSVSEPALLWQRLTSRGLPLSQVILFLPEVPAPFKPRRMNPSPLEAVQPGQLPSSQIMEPANSTYR